MVRASLRDGFVYFREPFHVLSRIADQIFNFEAHSGDVVHAGKVETPFASVEFSLVMGEEEGCVWHIVRRWHI